MGGPEEDIECDVMSQASSELGAARAAFEAVSLRVDGGGRASKGGKGRKGGGGGGVTVTSAAAAKTLGEELRMREEAKKGDSGWHRMQVCGLKILVYLV
jgi:hypothetical protein